MQPGRPTSYSPEYINKVDEYLATCVESEVEFHKTRGEKSDSYERIQYVNIPKIEGFAQFLNVSKDSLYEWEKIHDGFSDALDRIRIAQHNIIVDGAIAGRFNPTISALILSNNHGYRAKSDMTTDGKPITVKFDNSFNENE